MAWRLAAAAFAAVAAWTASAAEAAPLRPPPGLYPVTTLWAANDPVALCAPGRTLRVSSEPFTVRSGAFSRHRELTAQILAPEPLARRVRRKAQECAEQAAGAIYAASLLLGDDNPASRGFAGLLETCLRQAQAAPYMGAVTLWIDSDCAL